MNFIECRWIIKPLEIVGVDYTALIFMSKYNNDRFSIANFKC